MTTDWMDFWPCRINGVLVEPLSGVVKLRRPGSESIELEVPQVRELAAAANPNRRTLLLAAAEEAVRQEHVLHHLMGDLTPAAIAPSHEKETAA